MSQNIDAVILHQLDEHIADDLPMVRSVVVSRGGRMVYERHYAGATVDKRVKIQSCTKGVVSLLVGILIKAGNFPAFQTKIVDVLPSLQRGAHPSFEAITVRQCLNMTLGYQTDIADYNVLAAISRPFNWQPGGKFYYNDIGPQIISTIIQTVTGLSTSAFANAALFKPLGIVNPPWYRAEDGVNVGGWGLNLSPREMITFGQMALHRGNWNGMQLADEAYFEQSTSKQSAGGFPGHNEYGYLWWVSDKSGQHSYYGLGFGGQLLCVCPALDLVAVVVCTEQLGASILPAQAIYFDYIMKACQ